MRIRIVQNEERKVKALAESDSRLAGLLSASHAQVDSWVDTNVNTLADVKAILKLILKLLVFLARGRISPNVGSKGKRK